MAAQTLDEEVAALKADVASLSQDLFELEEEVLHPADTQFAVYLSLANRDAFILDSVELSINGRPAVSHLYTDQERAALEEGGIQRLYLGNLPAGEHQLSATFNGQGANDRYVRREASFTVRKNRGETQVQFVLEARAPDYRPEFSLREWQ
ncbi:AraC family transcriptional regulator [Marinobacter sp.]|uniref:AraC family transcriptional regulator n=1 Tax=Marinobacter sp. TaxID=50741 RepID=UPI003850A95C